MRHFKVIILILTLLVSCQFMCAQPKKLVAAKHLTYTIVYDYSRMSPAVVFWNLDAADFSGTIKAKPKYFRMDTKLPKPRLKNDAFTFSGYQRGHLCPSGDRDTRKDWFKDTFVTSNIVPMTPECNSGAWKETEAQCRTLALSGHPLSIACGPIWLPTTAVSNTFLSPLVPDSLWKIAVCRVHENEVYYWRVPNDRQFRSAESCRTKWPNGVAINTHDITQLIRSWLSR